MKTVVGILSFFAAVFILSMPVEAVLAWKDAVVRASDGNVYEIVYTTDYRIENFYIRGLNGEVPSREVAAELYLAAGILNIPPIENPVDLGRYIDEVFTNTAKWKLIHEIAGVIGSAPYKILLAKLTGGTSAAEDVADIAALIGGVSHDAAVLVKARMVGDTFAERSEQFMEHYNAHWLWVEGNNATSIDNIKAANLSWRKEARYRMLTLDIVTEHLFLPDWKVRVGNYLVGLVPFVDTVAFLGDAVLDEVQLGRLEKLLESAEEDINSKASAEVDAFFGEARISNTISLLESAGFYDRKPLEVQEEIPDEWLWLPFDEDYELIDLTNKFSDPNGDPFRLSLKEGVTDENVATVRKTSFTVSGEQKARLMLAITPRGLGETLVTVVATETTPFPISVEQTFKVVVTPANSPPQIIKTLPAQTLRRGSSSPQLDLDTYFLDLDSARINYAARSNNTTVATVQRVGSVITILAKGSGTATVTVTATDSDGASTTQPISVTVEVNEPPPKQPIPTPIPIGLRNGDPIIVQNTGSIGLNIRSEAQVSNQNPDNRIGKASDGATGTIMEGPQQDAEGRTWWKVEWDSSNKVQWTQKPANNHGWSVESIGQVGLLARRPSDPVTQSYDLAIQTFTVSKDTLDPGESFTLSITIHNNGPGDAPGPMLSYYHSASPGFSATDPPQLQGTVSLNPLASGESRTESIQLVAPSTPKTYYYGAWLGVNTGDTNLNNDFATEVGVTISDDPPDDRESSDRSDLIVKNISVDYDTMHPGERFTVSATVQNVGGRRAPNTRLRYYRSSDSTFSTDDEEIANKSDGIGALDSGETSDEDVHLDAPSEPGVYYYIARVDKARNEVKTNNNYASIKITVLPPRAPDLVVSLSANRYLVDPGKWFRLDATIFNQGEEDSRHTTTVRFYRSSDPTPSLEDEEIAAETVKKLRDGSDDEESENGPAPKQPGVYYYYACVDSVPDERKTDNNCSNVVTINVRGPDLIVNSIRPDLFTRKDTLHPNGIFVIYATVRNQGTENASSTMLRYYHSSDEIISPTDDTKIHEERVPSLRIGRTLKEKKTNWLYAPYAAGVYYYYACVDIAEDETHKDNNCSELISVTVRNIAPQAEGSIATQTLHKGISRSIDVSDYFSDANKDNLIYTVSTSDPNIVTVNVSGSQVTLTPQETSSANVTVTASDGALSATQTIAVTVENPDQDPPAEVRMPDANLRGAVRTALGLATKDALTQQALLGLTQLKYGGADLRDNDALTQQALLGLTRLKYGGADLRDNEKIRDLTGLEHALNLEHLNLYAHLISDIRPLENLAKLKSLWLAGNKITDIHPLTNLPLEGLDLGGNPITDFAPLAELTSLTRLDFWGNGLGDTDLTHITGLTLLTQLDLRGNKITNVKGLTQLVNLEKLALKGNPISDAAPLRELLRQNPNLEIDIEIDTEAKVPDLTVDSVNINRTLVKPGHNFQLTATIRNQGKAKSTATALRYYLSMDEDISTADTLLTTLDINPVAVGATREFSVELLAPDISGTYYYGVCVDEIAGETDTDNNCSSVGTALIVEGADLMIEDEPQMSKTTVAPGETFQIDTSVWNQGRVTASQTELRYYLSADETLSPEDTEVASDPIPSLFGKGANSSRRRAEVQNTLTAPETPGVHYYIVCVDEVAGDPDILNNCSQAIAITVEAPDTLPGDPQDPNNPQRPDPGDLQGPDLVISMTRVDASTIKVLAGVRLHITLTNQGTETASATTIRYCRSEDATISAEDDTELRAVPVGGLGAGKSYTTWALLPGSTSVGTYYYGACLDSVPSEVDTTNNCSDAIQITVIPHHEDTGTLRPTGTISQQELEVGDSPVVIDMSRYFAGTVETWAANSSKTDVVTASMSGSEVTLTPVKDGWTTVTIEASRGDSAAEQTFLVSVGAAAPGLAPIGTIPKQALEVGDSPVVLNVSRYFVGNIESWTAISNKPYILTVSMSGAEVTLTPIIEGPAEVTIEASSGDLKVKQIFSVFVAASRGTEPIVPSDPNAPDTSPPVSISDAVLRGAVRSALSLEADDTLTQQKMQKLTALKVTFSGIKELTGLEHATNLRRLEIHGGPLSDLTPLAKLTSLTFLWFNDTKLIDITPLTGLTNLTNLSILGNPLIDITPLAGLTGLLRLSLNYNDISDITPLTGLTSLTFLSLEGNTNLSNITPLAGLTSLTWLAISETAISNTTSLAGLTKLTELTLIKNQISDITGLAGLTNVQNLSLRENQISNITPLAGLTTKLLGLDLRFNDISDITPLAGLTKLAALSLDDNDISDITSLENLTALMVLQLIDNQISDVTPLENLTNLVALALSGNPIADLEPLRKLKQKNPSVNIDININAGAAPSAPLFPAETALLPNYPNPFNPETWIPYQLAKGADVTLAIYDVRGVMVRRLVLGHRPAGFYYSRGRAAHWDGRNALGEKVSSGLYFYTFTAGDFTATQKLLIRK